MTNHIENRDGVYYVPGTRVSLDSIVYAFRQGASPEAIREDFEALSLSDAYGAIAFYLDNKADIDAYLLARGEQWRELERNGAPPSAELNARIERARQPSAGLR